MTLLQKKAIEHPRGLGVNVPPGPALSRVRGNLSLCLTVEYVDAGDAEKLHIAVGWWWHASASHLTAKGAASLCREPAHELLEGVGDGDIADTGNVGGVGLAYHCWRRLSPAELRRVVS